MHFRLLPIWVLAVSAPLVVAGCGGGSGSQAASATDVTTTSGAPTATGQQSELSACLRKHGVNLPAGFGQGGAPGGGAPGGGSGAPGGATPPSFPAGGAPGGARPGGVDQQKLQAAFKACGGSPRGGGFPGGGGANSQVFTAYLSCLSDHGVSVPTSTSGTTPRGAGSVLATVRNDPKFAAANKTCQALLPTAGGSTTTTAAG